MKEKTISVLLIVVGIIHLLPVSGVLGAARLSALYGLTFEDPNLLILMQHRAVLVGLIGLFMGYAAFRPSVQPLAFIAGFISMVSFVVLAYSRGSFNAALARVVLADIVGLVSLTIAFGVWSFRIKGREQIPTRH